jgi:hypothetical protein
LLQAGKNVIVLGESELTRLAEFLAVTPAVTAVTPAKAEDGVSVMLFGSVTAGGQSVSIPAIEIPTVQDGSVIDIGQRASAVQ